MGMPEYLFEACDTIDASVFSGDCLHTPKAIEEFKLFVERWKNQIPVIEEAIKENARRIIEEAEEILKD